MYNSWLNHWIVVCYYDTNIVCNISYDNETIPKKIGKPIIKQTCNSYKILNIARMSYDADKFIYEVFLHISILEYTKLKKNYPEIWLDL